MKPNDSTDVAFLKAQITDHALMMKRLIEEATSTRTQLYEDVRFIDYLINMLFLASSGMEDEYRAAPFIL